MPKTDLSTKTFLVMDHGLYLPQALKLGEKAKKVWYHLSEASPYPESPRSRIGTGFDEIERVGAHEQYIDKADYIVFFDVYYGGRAKWLKEKGYKVFSAEMAEEMELDRALFLEILEGLGLPVPHTYRADGVEDAMEYLDGKKDKYLKTSRYRGDFETYHFRSMKHAASWFDDLKSRLGSRASTIEILIQDPVVSDCEVGYDGFNVLGEFPKKGIIGYEIKDKGYIGRVVSGLPPIMQKVNEKVAPWLKDHGCQGHYTNELRITKSGRVYYTDPTLRVPSPPGQAMCEGYENYAEAIAEIAEGNVPDLEEKAEYFAELVLVSPWHEKHELYVEFPKEIAPYVKLKNATKRRGGYYCIPNGNGGFFGGVVAYGKSVKEVTRLVMERAEQIEADELAYESTIFDRADEAIEAGRRYGIEV